MAQVDKPTARLYQASAKGIKGDSPDKFVAIALDEGDMGAFDEDTDILATESTVSGLERFEITPTLATVTKPNDAVVASGISTAGAGATITGFGVMHSTVGESSGIMQWCAYNAAQPMESGDKVTNTGRAQFKLGS